MTTIVVRFSTREIAADSMVSSDESFFATNKLRKTKRGIMGGCGDWDKMLKMYKAIEEGKEADDLDVTVLELRQDGIWIYEGTSIPVLIREDFYAIGTGSGYAMGALHCGKSVKEACEIACLYDTSSHLPIDYMILEEKIGKPRVKQAKNR